MRFQVILLLVSTPQYAAKWFIDLAHIPRKFLGHQHQHGTMSAMTDITLPPAETLQSDVAVEQPTNSVGSGRSPSSRNGLIGHDDGDDDGDRGKPKGFGNGRVRDRGSDPGASGPPSDSLQRDADAADANLVFAWRRLLQAPGKASARMHPFYSLSLNELKAAGSGLQLSQASTFLHFAIII